MFDIDINVFSMFLVSYGCFNDDSRTSRAYWLKTYWTCFRVDMKNKCNSICLALLLFYRWCWRIFHQISVLVTKSFCGWYTSIIHYHDLFYLRRNKTSGDQVRNSRKNTVGYFYQVGLSNWLVLPFCEVIPHSLFTIKFTVRQEKKICSV